MNYITCHHIAHIYCVMFNTLSLFICRVATKVSITPLKVQQINMYLIENFCEINMHECNGNAYAI